jgi:CubicO group peptidase (beta-lactamase class C family)
VTEVFGFCDDRFAEVRDTLAASIATGSDVGASYALTIDGEMVIDLWGGHLDEDQTMPWQEDTIINVYSTTKTMSFLTTLMLADRGELDFDAPVARYWPEFAANGKEDVRVWHLMNHTAGLSGMDEPIEPEDLYDWDRMCSALARQAPWWEPGTATGYHAITQGYLIGEVVRRISGQTLGQFFATEIARPLQADFHIGVPESEFPRIAKLILVGEGEAPAPEDSGSISARTFRNPFSPAQYSWTDGWRKAEIPAANGHGNARSVARAQAPLACGGSAFGVRLFSEDIARQVMQPRISGTDLVMGVPQTFGLGFGIVSDSVPLSPNKNSCYWGGWGGSAIVIDQDARISAAYVMNKMAGGLTPDLRAFKLLAAVYRNL